jgi:hypothetical protein
MTITSRHRNNDMHAVTGSYFAISFRTFNARTLTLL